MSDWIERPRAAWIALAPLLVLIWATSMHPIRDPDFGWHLALGRYIAELGQVPVAEPFTHTAAGAPMVAHEWLSQWIMHLVSLPAGIVGLRVTHSIGAAAIALLLFWMLRRERVSPALAVGAVGLFVLVARSRFEPRPQMFNLAAMMILYHLVFVRRPPLETRQLLWIPLVVAIWANLHSGAVLFPALLAVYCGAEWAARRVGWRTASASDLGGGRLTRVAALGASCAVATLFTPNHVRLFPYVLDSNRINRGLSAEWSSILTFIGDPANLQFELAALGVAVTGFGLAVASAGRSRSTGEVAVAVFLALLPLSSARFVDLYFAPILFAATELSARFAGNRRARVRIAVGGYAVAAVAAVALLLHIDARQFHLWLRPAGNFQPVTFPAGATRFLDEVELEGRLFNIGRWGGYLLLHTYLEYPVFIDGRWVTIGERVARDSLVIEHRSDGADALLDAYGVDILLVPRGWMTDEIAADRGWLPVFENFNAGVYLRATADTAGDLARCKVYYDARRIPFDVQRGFDGQAAGAANPGWARLFRVEPRHVEHFGLWGNPIGVSPKRVVQGY